MTTDMGEAAEQTESLNREAAIVGVPDAANRGKLTSKQAKGSGEHSAAKKSFKPRALNHTILDVARLTIGPQTFLTKEEQADPSIPNSEKVRLAFRRYGKTYGGSLRFFRKIGQYDQKELARLERSIFTKLSHSGHNDTKNVVEAVNAMGLPEEDRKKWLAGYLAERSLFNSNKFAETREDDIRTVREQIGGDEKELEALLRVSIKEAVQRRDFAQRYALSKQFEEAVQSLGLDGDTIAETRAFFL